MSASTWACPLQQKMSNRHSHRRGFMQQRSFPEDDPEMEISRKGDWGSFLCVRVLVSVRECVMRERERERV